ncbi:DUF721 domain-containing protein [Acetobacter sp. LMG 1627]|uniref:DUF721 domain-containing protein n=1 Tax=Acetobacter conturbans TaxID=1737472 RepID=A0ABX0K081_9PROT|nr:DUF721 domain-containing protein [Acetobacter conturbans]
MLIPGITREAFRKRSPAHVTLFIDWMQIVGQALADRTEPRKLSAGTLTIACRGPVAMEIQHMQTALVDRINTWCGHRIVDRLKLVQDFQPTSPHLATGAKKQPRVSVPPVVVADLPEGPLREALEALGTRLAERKAAQK